MPEVLARDAGTHLRRRSPGVAQLDLRTGAEHRPGVDPARQRDQRARSSRSRSRATRRSPTAVAEPSTIRTGIASAEENGSSDAILAIVESGSCRAPTRDEEGREHQQVDRHDRVLQLLHPRDEGSCDGEHRCVEREPEDEPSDRERRRRAASSRGRSIAPVTVASPIANDGDEDQLQEPEHADPRDLARHQLPRSDRRQEHLDDAGALLLDHSRWPPRSRSRRAARRATGRPRTRPPPSSPGRDRAEGSARSRSDAGP